MSDLRRHLTPPPVPELVDPLVALDNLAAIRSQMDSLHSFLSFSVNANTILPKPHLDSISSQISTALQHVIINSASLISSSSQKDTRVPMIEIETSKTLDSGNSLSVVCNKDKIVCTSSSLDPVVLTGSPGSREQAADTTTLDEYTIHEISKKEDQVGNSLSDVFNGDKTVCILPFPHPVLLTQMPIGEIRKQGQEVVVEEDAAEEEEEEKGRECDDGVHEVVELDAVELLAEHLHFCEICGKGFRRDANLRMHMRAHGDRFKSPGALAKPENNDDGKTKNTSSSSSSSAAAVRFSCPYVGCQRNKNHKKFRALKSVVCVKNHFKRSHCPKMYACDRCNKKSFSVLADLKSHLRHCGEARWRCSCGTSFSRKDKLFGHMALFEGHMPAVGEDDDNRNADSTNVDVVMVMQEDDAHPVAAEEEKEEAVDDATMVETTREDDDDDVVFDDGFLERLGSIEDKFLQELLGTSLDSSIGIDGFFNF